MIEHSAFAITFAVAMAITLIASVYLGYEIFLVLSYAHKVSDKEFDYMVRVSNYRAINCFTFREKIKLRYLYFICNYSSKSDVEKLVTTIELLNDWFPPTMDDTDAFLVIGECRFYVGYSSVRKSLAWLAYSSVKKNEN